MPIRLNVKIDVDGLDKFKKYIEYIKKLSTMKTDKNFQDYIQKKCLDTVNSVSRRLINSVPTSNDDLKSAYLQNNKIKDVSNTGFVIYNDLSVSNKKYTFCVALAFEYGTGLIGQRSNISNAWEYNINQNTVIYDGVETDGWWISKDKAGGIETFGESKSGKAVITRGYNGMEIYRNSAEEIKRNMEKWVKEYPNKDGGVSQ